MRNSFLAALARVPRALRVDMRGFGKFPPLPPGAFGLDDWADDIKRVVAGFGAGTRFITV